MNNGAFAIGNLKRLKANRVPAPITKSRSDIMRDTKPAGDDTPPDFRKKQPFTEKPSDALLQMNVDIARHNLEVTLKRTKEGCFRAAKEIALEGDEEKARQMDQFVRSQYADEPRKMAEWDEIMARYDFTDDVLE